MANDSRVEVELVAKTDQFDAALQKSEKTAKTALDGVAQAGQSSAKSNQSANVIYGEMARGWIDAHEAATKASESTRKFGASAGLAAAFSEMFNERLGNTTRAAKGVESAVKQMTTSLLAGNVEGAGMGFTRMALSMAMITPVMTASLVGVAALTVGLALLGNEAMKSGERARDIANAYVLVGRGAELSKPHLDVANSQLREMGTYKDDVAAIQSAIAGIPLASEGTRESLTQLARVYAEVSKKEPAEAAQELAKAFAGGVGPLREFADRLNLLGPEEKKAMDVAAATNNTFAAQEIVVRALNARFSVQIQHLKELEVRYRALQGTLPGMVMYMFGFLERFNKSTAPLPPAGPAAPPKEDADRAALEARYNRTLIERRALEQDLRALERLRKEATSESRRDEIDALIEIARRKREGAEQNLGVSTFQQAEIAIARFRAAHAADTAGIARFEAQTWKKISEDHDLSAQARTDAEKRYLAARAQMATAGRGDALAQFKIETDLARQGSLERVMAGEKELEAAKRIFGAKSSQALEAEKRYTEAFRAYERERTEETIAQANIRQVKRLNELDLAEREVQFRRQIGIITASEEAAQLRVAAQQRYDIQLKTLQDELALQRQRPEEVRRINLEIEKLHGEHRLRLQQINNQARLETINQYRQIVGPIQASFASVAQGLLTGQMTAMQALAQIGQAALGSLINFAMEWLSRWVMAQILGAATDSAISTTQNIGKVMQHAAVAGAAAYASTAAIPIVGPFLAPGVAKQAYATTAAFAGMVIPFAERGFDVDSEGLAYLHKKEMVLPQQYADMVRQMAGGAGAQAGPLIGAISFGYKGRWSRREMLESADMIAEAVATRVRGFDPRLRFETNQPNRNA